MKVYRSKKHNRKKSPKRRSKVLGLFGGSIMYEYIIFHLYPIILDQYRQKRNTTIDRSVKSSFYFPFYVKESGDSANMLKDYFMFCVNQKEEGTFRNRDLPMDIDFILVKNELFVEHKAKRILIGYIDLIKAPILPVEKVYYDDVHQSLSEYFFPSSTNYVPHHPAGGFSGGRIVSIKFKELDPYKMHYQDIFFDGKGPNNNDAHYFYFLTLKVEDYKYFIYNTFF
jgi:hypothetical protein